MPPASSSHQPSSAKRQKPNVGSALRKPPGPDYSKGIEYWNAIDASVDGVLGGFGRGPVPHIEQLSSRLMLLSLMPSLHTFKSPLTPFPPPRPEHRLTVLDVGAGIGRVSKETLCPLFEDVILLEPVEKFVREAYDSALDGKWYDLPKRGDGAEKGDKKIQGRGTRVWFVKAGLQGCDPKSPAAKGESLGVVGESRGGVEEEGFGRVGEGEITYDVIWCQWCLGHMNTPDLIAFLKTARQALRDTGLTVDEKGSYESLIFVKENCCEDGPDGKAVEFLDEEDSSLTRSSNKWLEIFRDAGLQLIKEEVQIGMPKELFVVKAWALR